MYEKDFVFYLATPAWGESYINIFLNVSLPTLMAPDNLPFLCSKSEVHFSIYTTEEFASRIYENHLIKTLHKIATVIIEILYIPIKSHYKNDKNYHSYNKALYETKTNSYKDNLYKARLSKKINKVVVSLNADIVFCNDFFKKTFSILLTGKKVIEVLGPRGNVLEISNALNQKYYDPMHGYINISSLELLDLWIDNAHPLLNIHDWNGDSLHFNCSHIFWPIQDAKGWIARCFFLYPIILVLPNKKVEFTGTIDASLVINCGYNKSDAEVITNSQDLFCCELSEKDKFAGSLGERGSIDSIRYIYKIYGSNYNIELLKEKIILGSDFSSSAWNKVTEESNHVIDQILNLAEKINS